jgi:hypothetical protein
MDTEDEPSGARFTRAWVLVESDGEQSKITYPVASVSLVAEGGRVRRFAATYHRVTIGNTDFVARSLGELTAILREHLSDSPLHWEMRVEDDQKARAAREAKIEQLARAPVRAGVAKHLRRAR